MTTGRHDTEYEVAGLKAPVEIIVDEDGIPHIYADSSTDAFVAQGFNAARDRLWQMDLWRRRGLGKLSEIFGADFVETDRAARLFLFRDDLHAEWLAYGSDTKRVCTEFIIGINAFVGLTRTHDDLLPPEFTALGYEPEEWELEDIVRIRNQGVYMNISEEVTRAMALRDFGQDFEDIRQTREPHRPLVIPEGLDLDAISESILAVYGQALLPPAFRSTGERNAGLEGSNNWVVSGARTATGRPILANDPHRDTTSLPGMRYITHVSCPEFDVIGAGEPFLPGISIGHNGTIAFGFTVFMTDQEDLYVYELNPENPREYRYQDGWERFRVIEEVIEIAGNRPEPVELAFTRHGPVLHVDEERGLAFAARVAWLEPGMVPYLSSLEYMRAKNWDQFLAALNRWGAPGENLIFADVEGNIGWKPAALIPIRPNWDGALPVIGDGRYEWAGFYDMDELPSEFNPERGWIATANEYRFPEKHPLADKAGYFWAPPERKHRIDEVLAGWSKATVQDLFDLQFDTVSLPARRILELVRALPISNDIRAQGLEELLMWDHRMAADSREALIYEFWYRQHFRPALLLQHIACLPGDHDAEELVSKLLGGVVLLEDDRFTIRLLEEPVERLGFDSAGEQLAELVATTLAAAFDELRRWLGPESESEPWTWGRIHHTMATHPLRELLTDHFDDSHLRAGPLPRGGSARTVGLSAYDDGYRQLVGSTVRFSIDVGDWDNSIAINSPGQAGDPRSPFYTNLFEKWVEGGSFPLRYSKEAVERAVAMRIQLTPVPGPTR